MLFWRSVMTRTRAATVSLNFPEQVQMVISFSLQLLTVVQMAATQADKRTFQILAIYLLLILRENTGEGLDTYSRVK